MRQSKSRALALLLAASSVAAAAQPSYGPELQGFDYPYTTIDALTAAGYRVIAPDQIGFCKSTKPDGYQYSFQQLALNTHALLASGAR